MRCYVSFMEGSLTIIFPLWAQVIQLCCCFQGIWFLVAIGLCTCFVCFKFVYQSETMMILNIMILAARAGGSVEKSFAQSRMPLMPFFSETAHRSMIWYEWITSAFVSLPSFLAPVSVISYLYFKCLVATCNLCRSVESLFMVSHLFQWWFVFSHFGICSHDRLRVQSSVNVTRQKPEVLLG